MAAMAATGRTKAQCLAGERVFVAQSRVQGIKHASRQKTGLPGLQRLQPSQSSVHTSSSPPQGWEAGLRSLRLHCYQNPRLVHLKTPGIGERARGRRCSPFTVRAYRVPIMYRQYEPCTDFLTEYLPLVHYRCTSSAQAR